MSGASTSGARRTAVYRLYDADGALLYVGITYDLGRRWTQHAKVQRWWDAVCTQKIEWHSCREDAEDAERTAIRTEAPKYNITYGDPEYLLSDAEQLYFEWNKRVAPLYAYPDGTSGSGRVLESPYIIAPGTYQIRLSYDPDAEAQGYVRVESVELVSAGDEFAAEYGAQCNRPGVVVNGEPVTRSCSCYRHSCESEAGTPEDVADWLEQTGGER